MSIEQVLLRINNAKKELAEAEIELQRESDKGKIRWYDGMPVLVRDGPADHWTKRFLKQVCTDRPSIYECYNNVALPRFTDTDYVGICYWKECKPNYEMPSMLVWIPNTGVIPKGVKKAIIKLNGNIGLYTGPGEYSWDLNNSNPIQEYVIIEKD